MFTKIKRKGFAIIMAAVMAISIIPAIGVEQTEAASKNHVMETKVKFVLGGSGDDSCVLVNDIVTKKNVEYGKNYSLEMKIYVPAQFMEKGGIVVEPYLDFWGGEDGRTYYGGGTVLRSEKINKKSPVVKNIRTFTRLRLVSRSIHYTMKILMTWMHQKEMEKFGQRCELLEPILLIAEAFILIM